MPEIIQICGTSGSGKSYVVRALMKMMTTDVRVCVEGRKLPIGYLIKIPDVTGYIFIMGSYENPTGGCDTINDKGSMDLIDKHIRDYWNDGNHVIFEGLMVRNFNRGLPLYRETGKNLHILHLTTPIEQCYAAIRERREAKGIVGKENPKNTVKDMESHSTYARKMKEIGADVKYISREQILDTALDILRGSKND